MPRARCRTQSCQRADVPGPARRRVGLDGACRFLSRMIPVNVPPFVTNEPLGWQMVVKMKRECRCLGEPA